MLACYRARGRRAGNGLRSTTTDGYSDAAGGFEWHAYPRPNPDSHGGRAPTDSHIHIRGDTSTNANTDAVTYASGYSDTHVSSGRRQ